MCISTPEFSASFASWQINSGLLRINAVPGSLGTVLLKYPISTSPLKILLKTLLPLGIHLFHSDSTECASPHRLPS